MYVYIYEFYPVMKLMKKMKTRVMLRRNQQAMNKAKVSQIILQIMTCYLLKQKFSEVQKRYKKFKAK